MRAFDAAWIGLTLLTACAGGAAPTITAVTPPEPAIVPVSTNTQLTLQVGVSDDDGDLGSLRLRLTTPSKQVIEDTVDVTGQAGDARNATVRVLLQVAPPEPGTYAVDVIAVDREDNESSPVGTEFVAE